MRKLIIPLCLFGLLFINIEVGAQQPPIPPAPTVRLTLEQTHTIKEIILKDYKFPKVADAAFKVGDKAPANVELESFPELVGEKVSAIKSHKFFISGAKIVIIDVKDNTVAEVIE